jgi:2-desacetyl-2-hydroxyethyl bacteriochlorophyllide A dehydrogenase
MDTMLAAVYRGPHDIRLEEVQRPQPGPGEAVMRVRAVSICGTDLRIFNHGHFKIPEGAVRILGHELAGEIVAVGEQVTYLAPGTRVAVAPNVGCGVCWECAQGNNNLCPDYDAFGITLDGGFAEYMLITAPTVRQGNAVEIPDNLSFEEAALNEPLSCCYNAQQACRLTPGETTVIIGAGPMGLLNLLLARYSGAGQVIVSEIQEDRARQAAEFGADLVVDPRKQDLREAVLEATSGRGADVIIVAVGSAALQEQAVELAARGGRVNFFAGLAAGRDRACVSSNRIHYGQVTITGTTGSNHSQYRRTLQTLGSGQLSLASLVTARRPLREIDEAFADAASGEHLKVVVVP